MGKALEDRAASKEVAMTVIYLAGGLLFFALCGWFIGFADRLMKSGS
jgi:hypothetical protein